MAKPFDKIDKEEIEKVKELEKKVGSGEKVGPDEIFGSKTIPRLFKEGPLTFFESFDNTGMLQLSCVFYPRILISICPECSCVKKPELIEPYLEREVVLPILSHSLADYDANFANLVVQYPYIGIFTLDFLKRLTSLMRHNQVLCEHCFQKSCKDILKKLSSTEKDITKANSVKNYLQEVIFPKLRPASETQLRILQQVEEVIVQRKLQLLLPLSNEAEFYHSLKIASIFQAVPQISEHDLSNIADNLDKMGISIGPQALEEIKDRELIAKALKLDYNPNMDIEEYLDIVLPRRKKISSLINELIESEEKENLLSSINDKIWEINNEISSSKAIETANFLTNFVFDNASILLTMLAGGVIGYSSASFLGCGLGSIGGVASATAGKLVSKHMNLRIPKYPRKTIEWLKEKIESPQQRLTAAILSKDVKVIQIWALRRKLERIERL